MVDCFHMSNAWSSAQPEAPIKFEFADSAAFAEWLDRVRPPAVQPSSALQRGKDVHAAVGAALQRARRELNDALEENRRLQQVVESQRIGAKGLIEDLAKAQARLDAVVTQNQELRRARDRAEKDLPVLLGVLRAKDVATACKIASNMVLSRAWSKTLAQAVLNACTPGPLTMTAEKVLSYNDPLDSLQKDAQ